MGALGLIACAPHSMHSDDARDSLKEVHSTCKLAEQRSEDLVVLYENLLDDPEDSLLIQEKIRLRALYQDAKWNCQAQLLRRDSSLNRLEQDWLSGSKDLKALNEREKMIEERIKSQIYKPLDSLRTMQ